jgi:hypothetical protein
VGLNIDGADASSRKIRMENGGDHQTSDGTRGPVHTDKIAPPVVRQQQRRVMLPNRDPDAWGLREPDSTSPMPVPFVVTFPVLSTVATEISVELHRALAVRFTVDPSL